MLISKAAGAMLLAVCVVSGKDWLLRKESSTGRERASVKTCGWQHDERIAGGSEGGAILSDYIQPWVEARLNGD